MAINNALFYFLYNFAHQSVVADNTIIFLAKYFPYVVIFVAGVFLVMHHEILGAEEPIKLIKEKKKELLISFFSGFFSWVGAHILKIIIAIDRPFSALADVKAIVAETGHAFPSGHAAFFSALAFSIYFQHKKAGLVFIFFALIIGFARVAAGVHYPVDILGGFVLGWLVAYFLRFFEKRIE